MCSKVAAQVYMQTDELRGSSGRRRGRRFRVVEPFAALTYQRGRGRESVDGVNDARYVLFD